MSTEHRPDDCNDGTCRICWGAGPVCTGCGDSWPCPTVRAGGGS